VDACVSRDHAYSLRDCGFVVRHVVDIDSAFEDHEIAKMMHADEVLITRDYRFYRMLGEARAILLVPSSNAVGRGGGKKSKPGVCKKKQAAVAHTHRAEGEAGGGGKDGDSLHEDTGGIMWLALLVT
jgi:hypothetical protein